VTDGDVQHATGADSVHVRPENTGIRREPDARRRAMIVNGEGNSEIAASG